MTNYTTCKCGRPKQRESKLCDRCERKTRNQDDLYPIIERNVKENYQNGFGHKKLGRMLYDNIPELHALSLTSVQQRTFRILQKIENENKTKLLKKDYAVIGNTKSENFEGESLWESFKIVTENYITENKDANKRTFIFQSQKPIGICFVSDQHIGNSGTDHTKMEKDAKLIGSAEGMYAILGGDGMDNFIKTKLLPAIINSKTSPTDQAKMLEYYLDFFNGHILAGISGNHEWWTKLTSGIDVLKKLHESKGLLYSPHEFFITIKLGSQEYRIFIRHKTRYNSSMNPTHTIKQMLRFGDYDFHIGVRGDEHQTAIEPFLLHGVKRLAVRSGSYKILDSFAEQVGFNRATPTCPVVILYPDKFLMTAFDNVEEGVKMLKFAREDYEQTNKNISRPPLQQRRPSKKRA